MTLVKVVNRHGFGWILVTAKGRTLYERPGHGCTAKCPATWRPLFLRHGTVLNTGSGLCLLGTARIRHRRQVTYDGHRLYTYTRDRGRPVRGNHVRGFRIVRFLAVPCPYAPPPARDGRR